MKGHNLQINNEIEIPANELEFKFIRASGPGGQNVNKVSSAVQLRFDIFRTSALESKVKERVKLLGGKRVTSDGVILIEAKRFRSQENNREDALKRLTFLILQALEEPKKRRKTKPSGKSKEKRLLDKHIKAKKKGLRKPPSTHED